MAMYALIQETKPYSDQDQRNDICNFKGRTYQAIHISENIIDLRNGKDSEINLAEISFDCNRGVVIERILL